MITYNYPVSYYIYESFEICKKENPNYIDLFEETENVMLKEMDYAKSITDIKGIKLYEYLSLAKTKEQLYAIAIALGENCIYNRELNLNEENSLIYHVELDKLGLFRGLIIYNLIGLLYNISKSGLPIIVELVMNERWKDIFEAIRPIINSIKKNIKKIHEFKIIYR